MPESVTIHLNPELVHTLQAAVETGEYDSTDEIMREALEIWQSRRDFIEPDLLTLRKLWVEGKQSGPAVPIDSERVLDQVRERLRKARLERFAHAG